MTLAFSGDKLGELSRLIAETMGLHFPPERYKDLEYRLLPLTKTLNLKSADDLAELFLRSPMTRASVDLLSASLTIGETYFFRDKELFSALEEEILPRLIEERRESKTIRIWSAACASGEEIYSVAILLKKLISDLKPWNITLLATDINLEALKKTMEGRYTRWSFRDEAVDPRPRWFTKTGANCWEIDGEIKKMVTFSYLNLVKDSYPSSVNNTNAMDLVLCRNVLMYFTSERASVIITSLGRALVPGGLLALSPVEFQGDTAGGMKAVNHRGYSFYSNSALPPVMEAPPLQLPLPEPEGLPLPPEATELVERPFAAEDPQAAWVPVPVAEELEKLYAGGFYQAVIEKITPLLSGKTGEGCSGKEIVLLAKCCANTGKLAEALEFCGIALKRDKMNPSLHYLQAMILNELGEAGAAVKALKKAIYLDHKFAMAYFTLGNLELKLGNIKEFKKCFQNFLSLLNFYNNEATLQEAEGVPAGKLRELAGIIIAGQLTGAK